MFSRLGLAGGGGPRRSVRRADSAVEAAEPGCGGHSCRPLGCGGIARRSARRAKKGDRHRGSGVFATVKPTCATEPVSLFPPSPKLVVASIQSLLQPVPSRETLKRKTRELRVGDNVGVRELAGWLVESGLVGTPAVDLPGEFAVRGGIVDIFAPDWDEPVRVEFFGDQIESIRRFEIASQRSLASLDSIDVTILGPERADRSHLAEYLPPHSWFVLLEPMELEHQGRQYLERMGTDEGSGFRVRVQGTGLKRDIRPFILHPSSFFAQSPIPNP